MKHYCHAYKCLKEVPPRLFACGHHWRILPAEYRKDILKNYRPGQENDKFPSLDYIKAANRAKLYLAGVEHPEDLQGLTEICNLIEKAFAERIDRYEKENAAA